MLIDTVKSKFLEARKARDKVATGILSVVIGEYQSLEAKGDVSDDNLVNIIKKLIKSNQDTLQFASSINESLVDKCKEENEILTSLLPSVLSPEELLTHLDIEEIKGFKSDGQAIGTAIKTLKALGLAFDNSDIPKIVKEIRK